MMLLHRPRETNAPWRLPRKPDPSPSPGRPTVPKTVSRRLAENPRPRDLSFAQIVQSIYREESNDAPPQTERNQRPVAAAPQA